MAEKVRLIMEADNSQHVKAVKDVQNAHVSLNATVVKNQKREKGLIEDIESALTELEASKKKAYDVKSIEKHNQKIAEAKQSLKEYNEAGVKTAQTTESMTQKMTKWVVGLGGALVALRALKDLFMSTTAGINSFNIAGVAARQVFSNLVSGAKDLTTGLRDVISAQRELNKLRLEDLKIERASIQEMTAYKDALIQGHDQMLTTAERIKAYDDAIQHLDNSIRLQKKNVTDELAAVDKLINAQTIPSEKLLIKHARLMMQLDELDKRQSSGLNEVMSMRSGLIKKGIDDRQKMEEDAVKELIRLDNENTKERAVGWKAYTAAEKALQEARNETRKELAESENGQIGIWDRIIAKTSESQEIIGEILDISDERERERMEAEIEAIIAAEELKREVIEETDRIRLELIQDSTQATLEAINLLDVIQQAGYNRELARLDQFTQIRLDAAGNDVEKRMEIQQEYEDRKAKLDEEADAKAKKLRLAALLAEKAAAIATIIIEFLIAKAKAIAALPLTLGQPITGLLTGQMIITLAAVAASTAAGVIANGFAEGGWTGKGGHRDKTGERVAGIVHEEEFVIKRGPAAKHREILEAINRDDKRALMLSMGNIPEMAVASPNVLVNSSIENSGPNSRLDKLINENRRLNTQIANATSIQDLGKKRIVKRGNHVRIINS